jgi:hypothetical protein
VVTIKVLSSAISGLRLTDGLWRCDDLIFLSPARGRG